MWLANFRDRGASRQFFYFLVEGNDTKSDHGISETVKLIEGLLMMRLLRMIE